MNPAIVAPKRLRQWRSWAHIPGEDLVEMPRTLALDLIRLADVSSFLHEASEEDAEADRHYPRWEAHKKRMEKIACGLAFHLCEEDITPTAEIMLRALVMAYEAAEKISKPGELVDALPVTA